MTGERYHSLLKHRVFPELRRINGGNLENLYWAEDRAPCHTNDRTMAYLDRQFGERVASNRSIRGRNWPARSPDLNPLDYCVWGCLKSKVPMTRKWDCPPGQHWKSSWSARPWHRRAILDVKFWCYKCIAANGEHLNRCRIKCVNIGGDVLCRPIAIDWKGVE